MNKPCPICKKNNSLENIRMIDDTEVITIECNICLHSTSKDNWNSDRRTIKPEMQKMFSFTQASA